MAFVSGCCDIYCCIFYLLECEDTMEKFKYDTSITNDWSGNIRCSFKNYSPVSILGVSPFAVLYKSYQSCCSRSIPKAFTILRIRCSFNVPINGNAPNLISQATAMDSTFVPYFLPISPNL